jgi:biofilm protein TabA
LADKDCAFYKNVKDEMDLVLTLGVYAVFFPEEVHRPNCQYGASGKLHKVVVKVAAELL